MKHALFTCDREFCRSMVIETYSANPPEPWIGYDAKNTMRHFCSERCLNLSLENPCHWAHERDEAIARGEL